MYFVLFVTAGILTKVYDPDFNSVLYTNDHTSILNKFWNPADDVYDNFGHDMNYVSIANGSTFSHVAFALHDIHNHIYGHFELHITYISSNCRHFMVYCGGASNTTISIDLHIRGAYSNGSYQWARNRTVFSDVDSTRDPMLFYDENLFISLLFYTSSPTHGNQDAAYGIFGRKSTNLVNWGEMRQW